MKKYLVTGGAGFIGSSIVEKLISSGHQVTVLDNLQRGSLKKLMRISQKYSFVSADIRDTNKVIKASKNHDGIIHLAYVNGTKYFYTNPDLVLEIAVKGMQSVIEAGRRNKISELYLASSSEVYQVPKIIPTPEDIDLVVPDPYNPRFSYGGGKIISELMAIHIGKNVFEKIIIFRPHNVYGPDMGNEHVIPEFIKRIEKITEGKKDFIIEGTGKETRSYIFIEDFANAFIKVFTTGKNLNTYNIGTENEKTSHELAKIIAKLMGKKIKVIKGKLKTGSTPRRCPNILKIKKLGFKEKFSLEEGLKKTIEWYTNRTI